MFLSDLTSNECKLFLDLAYLAMEVSGKIDVSELKVFQSYMHECRLPNYKYNSLTLEEILEELKNSTQKSKKIILVELMGIWSADNSWDDDEIEMMYKIGKSFDVSKHIVNRIRRWSKEMKELIMEGCELIMR